MPTYAEARSDLTNLLYTGGGIGRITPELLRDKILAVLDAFVVEQVDVTTSGSSLLKGNGSGGITNATAGTDYYNPGGTKVALADGGTGAGTVGGAQTALQLVPGTHVEAKDANIARINVTQTYTKAQRGQVLSLTSTSNSIALDLSLSNNFSHTLTENTTLANPTNVVAGQGGLIIFTQDGSTPRTLELDTNYVVTGGVDLELTASVGAIDILSYFTISSSVIWATMFNDVQVPS